MTYIISKMADDHMEVIPPSDNENDESEFENESGLLQVVNEHNEVLGVVLADNQHPPYQSPLQEQNMFSSSESETSDNPNYFVESIESEGEQENIPQIRLPLKNYSQDTEHPDDFENNWQWVIEDTGPSYGPFTGMPGLNIPPNKLDPIN